MTFTAIVLNKDAGEFRAELTDLDDTRLMAGNVTVKVDYSTLNYKDALALTDRAPVVRRWPMVPGIDCAGTVETSTHPRWRPGDPVILNGWGAGEAHWGGLAQKARLDGDWLIARPDALSASQAMAIGTAGYTAMLCCMALDDAGVEPGDGEVLVTGASGGVGSVAVALLASRGYRVTASTGKSGSAGYLAALGATTVIDRAPLAASGTKPLQKEKWAGVVDCAGSHTLANALAQTRYGGTVACCGLAQGMDLPASVAPFILRAVKLVGIDSVMCPPARRERAWALLAAGLDRAKLDAMTQTIGLPAVFDAARALLAGEVQGRVVVRMPDGTA